jgi:hypothetical protein
LEQTDKHRDGLSTHRFEERFICFGITERLENEQLASGFIDFLIDDSARTKAAKQVD